MPKKNAWAYLVLLGAMCVSGAIVFSDTNYPTSVIGLAVICFAPAFLVDLEMSHPYVWYLPLYFLYSASLPILVAIDVMPDLGFIHETIRVEWAAACAFIIAVGPWRRPNRYNLESLADLELPAWVLFGFSLLMTALFLAVILTRNLTTKFEIALSGSLWTRLDPFFSVMAVVYAVLLALSLARRRFPWSLVTFTMLWNALAFGIAGERDYIFRVIWITILLIHILYRRLQPVRLLFIGLLLLALIPIAGDLKNFLVTRQLTELTFEAIPERLLGDEFLTASENLRLIIDDPPWKSLWGETLIWDLQQAMFYGSLFPELVGAAPQTKFNKIAYPETMAMGGGRGFSLVGEGYLNFGFLGAVLWYLMLGAFVSYLYKRSATSLLWTVCYVVAMPLIVYVTRADFSNLLSQFIKHIALPVLLIYEFARLKPRPQFLRRNAWSETSRR